MWIIKCRYPKYASTEIEKNLEIVSYDMTENVMLKSEVECKNVFWKIEAGKTAELLFNMNSLIFQWILYNFITY